MKNRINQYHGLILQLIDAEIMGPFGKPADFSSHFLPDSFHKSTFLPPMKITRTLAILNNLFIFTQKIDFIN